MTTKDLSKKHIMVVGAGRGIGRHIAQSCASHGAHVSICARSLNEIVATKKEIGDLFPEVKIFADPCDIRDRSQVNSFIELSVQKAGPLYGLICTAGIHGSIGPFATADFNDWQQAIEVNLIGVAYFIRQSLARFSKAFGGRIILFSGGGQGAMENFSSYVASKGGIWRLTETLGVELKGLGIFINCVAPGAVNTYMLDSLLELGPEKVGERVYHESLRQKTSGGHPSEKTCNLCLWLLSDSAKGLTGKILSAVWDPYQKLKDLEQISASDLFNVRRVVDDLGNTRPK